MNEPKVLEPEVSSSLSSLSAGELSNLVHEYLSSKANLTDILAKYNLTELTPNVLRHHLPALQHKENVCPNCNVFAWRKILTRGCLSEPYCPVCKEKMYSRFSPGDRIIELENLRRTEEFEQRELEGINSGCYGSVFHGVEITNNKYEHLSFEGKVFIGTLVANANSKDFTIVEPDNLLNIKLAPKGRFIRQIAEELGLGSEGDLNNQLYIFEDEVGQMLLNPGNRLNGSFEEQYRVWQQIVLDEARELLEFQMQECGFLLTQGDIVEDILSSLLEDYSLAQVYHLIHSAVNGACKFYEEENNRAFAANSVIYSCRRNRDRYKSNGWTLTPYHRPWRCKQSELSRYYFDSVLQIGSRGFYARPSIEQLTINQFNIL